VTASAAVSTASRADLRAAWERSDLLFDRLVPGALLARPIRLRQPFLFYLGHLPAFAWNHLWRGALGRSAFAPELDSLFERGIDPPDDATETAEDRAAWPRVEKVLSYRDRVRRELEPVLEEGAVLEVLPMVLEHELMHHETLLYMLQQLPVDQKRAPDRVPAPARARGRSSEPAFVPAGPAVLGAPRGSGFRWDNEHEEHPVFVEAFRVDSLPVTNRAFLAFVEAGGYGERRLWSDDAWRWIERTGRRGPGGWRRGKDGPRVVTLFDERPFAEAEDWPAMVAQCEAAAYARWRGARLPTEAELHRAAFGRPDGPPREHPWGDETPRPEHANLGFRQWEPAPVGAFPAGASGFGVHELVGNGWEWTSTVFAPLPGFAPLPRYPGYSADFFDGRHFVMLGASWATDPRLVRRSFRNWFQAHYPYVFSKFRCVHPA
jgi:ergothioneine biosynthesis protein EgtB